MKTILSATCCLLVAAGATAGDARKPLLTGLTNAAAVAVGEDGKIYVGIKGEADKDRTGSVVLVEGGKAVALATGVDNPTAMVARGPRVLVAGNGQLWRIEGGKPAVLAPAKAFPKPAGTITGLDVDEQGNVYAAAVEGADSAIFRINKDGKVLLVTDGKRSPALQMPAGLVMDGFSHAVVSDAKSGTLLRVKLADGSTTEIGRDAGGSLAWDKFGRLFFADAKGGRIVAIPRPDQQPVSLVNGLHAPFSIATNPVAKTVVVLDPAAGTLTDIPGVVPGFEVDESPLPLETAVAFPNLQWTGWVSEDRAGKPIPIRPLALTHAGDGSNRVFVATQHGVIHVFPNDQQATKTAVFLDLSAKVTYSDFSNEEGFLGLTFHPDYKKNGEFFVFYTPRGVKKTNYVSRFRVSKDDPNRADPASEEVILKITDRLFWNHDGGTICFGPDGYLYVAVGDGGLANDPKDHGQSLKTWMGKVLRIDVNKTEGGKNYAIPKDNPFAQTPDALPEIWAYGLRNIWRMAFDRPTGRLWASDVGQNLYEEIDFIVRGGNYGWNIREGLHPFSKKGVGPRKDLIEPIWEYHHDVGKSLTGGLVYRGKRLPELDGYYLYADYVSSKIWALKYDDAKGRVVANRPIRDPNVPVLSFGEDEAGDAYFMTFASNGKGIYRFVRPGTGSASR